MTKKSGTEGVTLHLNILSLSIFIHHLSFSVSLSSVSLFHNPVPPATISIHNHHIHPPSPQPQTTAKKKKALHIQSHKIKKSSKSKNHKIKKIIQINKSQQRPKTTPINPQPSLNHPDQPTNPATEIKNPPKSIKTTEIKTHRYQNAKPTHRTITKTHHEPL